MLKQNNVTINYNKSYVNVVFLFQNTLLCCTYSVEMLDKGRTHVLKRIKGGTAAWGIGQQVAQIIMHLKNYGMFVSGIFHLMFWTLIVGN